MDVVGYNMLREYLSIKYLPRLRFDPCSRAHVVLWLYLDLATLL